MGYLRIISRLWASVRSQRYRGRDRFRSMSRKRTNRKEVAQINTKTRLLLRSCHTAASFPLFASIPRKTGSAVSPLLCTEVKQLLPQLGAFGRSEEHTSELQSHVNLVCRLLLEKKNK